MNKDGQPTGALPPYEKWHDGLNEYEICFIDDAKRFIKTNKWTNERAALEIYISELLSGKEKLGNYLGVEEFFKTQWVLLAGKTKYRICKEYKNEVVHIKEENNSIFLGLEQLDILKKILEEVNKK